MKSILKIISLFAIICFSSINIGAVTADDVLSALKQRVAPDKRTAIWDVQTISQNGIVTLKKINLKKKVNQQLILI